MKLKNVFLNISYTLSSNLLSLIVSTIVTLFLPKLLGISFYGYFQLYLFYTSYVGFLHLGWCDGIYLKYGGEHYSDLNRPLFKGQFYLLLFFQTVVTIIFLIVINMIEVEDYYKALVSVGAVMNILILNIRTFSTFILQATNRMKEYSKVIILDRVVYVLLVLALLLFKIKGFYWYILADIIGKTFSVLLSLYFIKDLIFVKGEVSWSIKEAIDNIKVGINLMFANIASTLIIGIIRFGIQREWDVETFGKISLTLSISSLMMVFVNAISLAIFPLLKRTDKNEYATMYKFVRTILMPLIFIVLIFYYPLNFILIKWLPAYSASLKYMAIVFPIVVFECKVSLLTNTYLKVLRKERYIFIINLMSAFFSLVLTVFSVFVMKNLILSMVSIVLVIAFRSTISEVILGKQLKVEVYKDIIFEYILVIIFIISSWNLTMALGSVIYIVSLFIYLFVKSNDIKLVYRKISNS